MQVLIKVSRGIIQGVVFYHDPAKAIRGLSDFVKGMNVEHDDAALYDLEGFIANAKHFLDEDDQYSENESLIEALSKESDRAIFIIGNPRHALGFMVASPDDPLGYRNPANALAELGQMRHDSGNHLMLYRVLPVNTPVASRADVERSNADWGIEDFDYSLIEEYLF